ncbi:MAG: radical SAM protein, partial [Nitrospirota bacterium]
VHRNFSDINALLPELSLRKVLFTNGLLLGRELLEGLAFDEIQVSVDGLEESHDALRGKGTFRKAMEAIELALSVGFEVSVATMVHAKNLADFEKMEQRFSDMGIKEWTVDVPCVTGRLENYREFQIGPEEGGKFLRFGFGKGYHSGSPGFACGPHLMSVMADGSVAKCSFYGNQPAGRVEDGLRACRHRIKPMRLAELACDCEHVESCRGGCRYRAALLGDPCGKDLYRCFLYDTMKSM